MFGNLFNPSKWSLSTIGDAAGLAGAGILGGFIPGSQAIGAGLSFLGGATGSGSQTPQYKPGDLENQYNFLAQRDLDFFTQNADKRYNAINQAADALDPRNDYLIAQYVQNGLMRNADREGRIQGNTLTQRGYASSVGDAAQLDARNRAQEQSNDYFGNLTNPMSRAQRYAQTANLYSMNGTPSSLSGLMGLQTQRNNQRLSDLYYEANRPATTLETGLGLLGQLGPYMNRSSSNRSYLEPIGPQPDYLGLARQMYMGGLV